MAVDLSRCAVYVACCDGPSFSLLMVCSAALCADIGSLSSADGVSDAGCVLVINTHPFDPTDISVHGLCCAIVTAQPGRRCVFCCSPLFAEW